MKLSHYPQDDVDPELTNIIIALKTELKDYPDITVERWVKIWLNHDGFLLVSPDPCFSNNCCSVILIKPQDKIKVLYRYSNQNPNQGISDYFDTEFDSIELAVEFIKDYLTFKSPRNLELR